MTSGDRGMEDVSPDRIQPSRALLLAVADARIVEVGRRGIRLNLDDDWVQHLAVEGGERARAVGMCIHSLVGHRYEVSEPSVPVPIAPARKGSHKRRRALNLRQVKS